MQGTKKVIWLPCLAKSTIKLWRYYMYTFPQTWFAFDHQNKTLIERTNQQLDSHAHMYLVLISTSKFVNFSFVLLRSRASINLKEKNGKQIVFHVWLVLSLCPFRSHQPIKLNEVEKKNSNGLVIAVVIVIVWSLLCLTFWLVLDIKWEMYT